MAGIKRERELARAKYERQQARRAQARARRRRRNVIVASALTALLVLSGLGALVGLVGDDDDTSSLAEPSDTTTTAPGDCSFTEVPAQGGVEAVPPPPATPDRSLSTATITTNQGDITLRLLTEDAPCTVHNFAYLAGQDYYDGTECHRLLTTAANSALQCGDPSADGSGGPGYQFPDENLAGATYPAGTVAMANSGPNTNGSQFFMVFADSTFDGPFYTPFAEITDGLDVLEEVGKAGTDESEGTGVGKPKTAVVIEDVTVS